MRLLLNMIGCGKAGRTLGRLWADAKVFEIQDILTTSGETAAEASFFIGQGKAVSAVEELRPAAATVIATPEEYIESCCNLLAGL